MPRYEMTGTSGSGSSGGAMTLERYIEMQEAQKSKRSAKRMQWITLGVGAFGLLNATNQQPIEDKRSAIDAPAVDAAASDVEDFDFSTVPDPATRALLVDFAAVNSKIGRATATALQRGVDNNGKQGILGGGSGNNNNLLLLLGFVLLADSDD